MDLSDVFISYRTFYQVSERERASVNLMKFPRKYKNPSVLNVV